MVKEIGYRIFAFVYYICRLFTVNNLAGNKRFFCVMTHDDGESSNVSLVISRLKKTEPGYKFSYITKTEVGSVRGFKNVRNLLSFS